MPASEVDFPSLYRSEHVSIVLPPSRRCSTRELTLFFCLTHECQIRMSDRERDGRQGSPISHRFHLLLPCRRWSYHGSLLLLSWAHREPRGWIRGSLCAHRYALAYTDDACPLNIMGSTVTRSGVTDQMLYSSVHISNGGRFRGAMHVSTPPPRQRSMREQSILCLARECRPFTKAARIKTVQSRTCDLHIVTRIQMRPNAKYWTDALEAFHRRDSTLGVRRDIS